MRISDWSSDVCSSDLGQIDAALHVIDPGPVEAVAVAAHRERVRKRAHRVDGVDMGDDEDAGTAIVRAGVKHSAIRSEESRVGKEWFKTFRSRWVAIH